MQQLANELVPSPLTDLASASFNAVRPERIAPDPDLPVNAYRDEILDAVHRSPAVVLVAETGAGKSTQISQMLYESGYENIVITQPRILAARSLANRVAAERGEVVGETVGYRTAMESCSTNLTRLLYCTDGYTLVHELFGRGRRPDVLVIDEVHEWNLNMEILVAWAKRELQSNHNFKVVLMSATIDQDRLARYFNSAPVINIPGRLFEVQERRAGESLVADAVSLLRKGHNVLIFQPGKAEIESTIEDIRDCGVKAEILPLHAELTPAEQELCFDRYRLPKCVVATDVAQSSITIADITAVIDSGIKREVRVVDGVEGLYLTEVSRADREQRKGRAGRTHPGIFIDHCPLPLGKRPAFPEPEIKRVQLDQAVLRLAMVGVNMEELEFFHQPSPQDIRDARRSLVALGCLDDEGKVTAIGEKVARLPVSAKIGRMIVEAERLGVVDDVITIAAIMEARDVINRKSDNWRLLCESERDSDCLAQLAVFKAAEQMTSDRERELNGIHLRHFHKAVTTREHIKQSLKDLMPNTDSNSMRINIMKAICAGMVDHVYRSQGNGHYLNGDSDMRVLSHDSVIEKAELIVGMPFDLEVPGRDDASDGPVKHLVTRATRLDPLWLAEVAPQHIKIISESEPYYDKRQQCNVVQRKFTFRGQDLTATVAVADTERPHQSPLRN